MRRTRTFRSARDTTRINQMIREKEVRLISAEGEHVGVVPIALSLEKAEEAGMDLVEITGNATPPVCRIMDYGKFKYEKAKKEKVARKKRHETAVKEVQMRPRIGQHDFDAKLSKARRFIGHGDKVRFVIVHRGREVSHQELGHKILGNVQQKMADVAHTEQPPRREGWMISMTLAPLTEQMRRDIAKKEAAEEQALAVREAGAEG